MKIILSFLLSAACVLVFAAEDAFITLSDELSPHVEASFERRGNDVAVQIRAKNPYGKIMGRLAAKRERGKRYPLNSFPAAVTLRESELGKGPLKLGLEISWFNRDGSLRQREVYLSPRIGNRLPPFGNLAVFDLEEHEQRMAARRERILIPVPMEAPGKATVVIEGSDGKRIRNLVSGVSFDAGKHFVEWDGRTESGVMARPGVFTVRTVTHPGLEYRFLMQFENGDEPFFTPWGPNHAILKSFAGNGACVFAAAPLTEGGNSIVALTPEGKFVRAYPQIHGTGIVDVFLAADASRLYAVHGGHSWLNSKKQVITLTVYEIENSKAVPLKKKPFAVLFETERKEPALSGMAAFGGKLYVGNRISGEIMVVNPADGTVEKRIPCELPGRLAASGGSLFMANEKGVRQMDAAGRFIPLFQLDEPPQGFHVADGRFFLSGFADSTVRVYGRNGKITDVIGIPGGDYTGKWQAERLVNPSGVYLAPDGSLWTAENRRNPKRIVRWSYPEKKILYEKYGSPSYGTPSAGFDPEKPERWIADGTEWRIDYRAKTAVPVNVLLKNPGHARQFGLLRNYRFFEAGKRKFVTGAMTGVTVIAEYLPAEGRLKDLALFGSVHHIYRHSKAEGRAVLTAELDKAYPGYADDKKRIQNRSFMLWSDRNGNGMFDAGEFQFAPEGSGASVGYWGMQVSGMEFQVLYSSPEKKTSVLTMAPAGFNSCGAPVYSLKKAIAEGKSVKDEVPPAVRSLTDAESFNLTDGGTVTNTTPFMFCFSGEGKIGWLMKNLWTNVHGSQKAPLPRAGEMQGVLFSLGSAKLGDGREVMALMGNHGRVFFLTGDGIYLDELFSDCRLAGLSGVGMIGGEPFGGVFGRDEKNGRYLLQGGNSGYRIYEIMNLNRLTRREQKLTLSQSRLETAVRLNPAEPEKDRKKGMKIPYVSAFSLNRLNSAAPAASWRSGALRIELRAAFDARNLYLQFRVPDASPWVNNGKIWTNLFKTGDCVDLQLALDPAAKAKRRNAVPGDIRLLAAPFENGTAAVLYRHKVKGNAAGLNPMEFTSPWRSARVEDVRRLDGIEFKLERGGDWYRIGMRIPLSELGTSAAELRGKTLRGDFGVIFGDRAGTMNLSRVYWSNRNTGLVNDVPGEMLPEPSQWDHIQFGE